MVPYHSVIHENGVGLGQFLYCSVSLCNGKLNTSRECDMYVLASVANSGSRIGSSRFR